MVSRLVIQGERTRQLVKRLESLPRWPEARRTKKEGMEKQRRSHGFWSREGSVYNWRSLSSRLLLPEQILAELLRHHRLQPAPLTGSLPLQPLTANSGGSQRYPGGRAILPTAGHVPEKHGGTPQAQDKVSLPSLKKKGAFPTERSAPTRNPPPKRKGWRPLVCLLTVR